ARCPSATTAPHDRGSRSSPLREAPAAPLVPIPWDVLVSCHGALEATCSAGTPRAAGPVTLPSASLAGRPTREAAAPAVTIAVARTGATIRAVSEGAASRAARAACSLASRRVSGPDCAAPEA